LAHSPKGTPSGLATARAAAIALRPFVGTRFQVLFHSLYQGSFHLSLTVLVRYRSSNVFSLGRWTSQLPTELACSVVLRRTTSPSTRFAYGTLTLSGASFQSASATGLQTFAVVSYNPGWTCQPVWAFPLSLATTQGILSFPEGTEMFQFPSFPPDGLCVQPPVTGVLPAGFPHSDILGYSVRTQLPEAFRSVPRPS